MRGKRNTHTLFVGMYIRTTNIENSMKSPQKTKNVPPYDPRISLVGI
jgi:hypothetical protein